MDLSSLTDLGKIAGLGGIAIGAVVLIVRPMVERVLSVPAAERAPTLRYIATGAFGIGAIGIIAWLVGSMAGDVNVTSGAGGVAAGRDVSRNTDNMAPAPPVTPAPTAKP